jgi:hypothetical protein
MHFGKWIFVAFVLFAIFIGTLVTLCIREDISLVSKDYYKEELAYQEQIQRLNNTAGLPQKPTVVVTTNAGLMVRWSSKTIIDNGELKLFCPSNPALDKRFDLSHASEQVFNLIALRKGFYRIKLLWSSEGKEYYYEQEIYIG